MIGLAKRAMHMGGASLDLGECGSPATSICSYQMALDRKQFDRCNQPNIRLSTRGIECRRTEYLARHRGPMAFGSFEFQALTRVLR